MRNWRAWSAAELQRFEVLKPQYGRSFSKYLPHLPCRTYNQIKCQYHNTFKKQAVEEYEAFHQEKEIVQPKRIQLPLNLVGDVVDLFMDESIAKLKNKTPQPEQEKKQEPNEEFGKVQMQNLEELLNRVIK